MTQVIYSIAGYCRSRTLSVPAVSILEKKAHLVHDKSP